MSSSNILFYFPYNKTMTGGPRVLINLIDFIDRNKYTPIVITQTQSPLVEELIKRNVEVIIYPLPPMLSLQDRQVLKYGLFKKLKGFIGILRYNQKLIKLLKNKQIKLIWARNIKGVLFTGFAALFTKTALIWDIGLGDNFQGTVKLLHFIGLNLSDMVVTEGKSQHHQMFGRTLTTLYHKRLFHIMPGLGQDRIKAIENLPPTDTKPDTFKIISVASIGPRKNQKMLVVAAKKLIAMYPHTQVDFIGPVVDEKYFAELQEYIADAKIELHISFLGWRNDIIELMKKSNILVVCSHNEGIPIVVYEAMHAQLPVIATKVGGIPDAIVHRDTGFLIEPEDTDSLIQYLKLLIENPSLTREIGIKAKAFAQENFTYQAYYDKYEQLFTRVIKQHAKG